MKKETMKLGNLELLRCSDDPYNQIWELATSDINIEVAEYLNEKNNPNFHIHLLISESYVEQDFLSFEEMEKIFPTLLEKLVKKADEDILAREVALEKKKAAIYKLKKSINKREEMVDKIDRGEYEVCDLANQLLNIDQEFAGKAYHDIKINIPVDIEVKAVKYRFSF